MPGCGSVLSLPGPRFPSMFSERWVKSSGPLRCPPLRDEALSSGRCDSVCPGFYTCRGPPVSSQRNPMPIAAPLPVLAHLGALRLTPARVRLLLAQEAPVGCVLCLGHALPLGFLDPVTFLEVRVGWGLWASPLVSVFPKPKGTPREKGGESKRSEGTRGDRC